MSSHGKVLDLRDDNQLEIQDVEGNVELFPALVPYSEYSDSIVVYKMETDHDVFMGLIQDFTDRYVREAGPELWTWLVQWQVEQPLPDSHGERHLHLDKKPRLWTDSLRPNASFAPQSQPHAAQAKPKQFASAQRRWLDRELVQEEHMLRALLEIVHADTRLVPNYIELLYEIIDHYEGDGYALKCAVHEEIPSLWDFDKLPVTLPSKEHVLAGEKVHAQGDAHCKASNRSVFGESERSKYRERRIGLHVSAPNEPVTEEINIPEDEWEAKRYRASCFKSRASAINLLMDAGMSVAQIRNYDVEQELHPLATTGEELGNTLEHAKADMVVWEEVGCRKNLAPKAVEVLTSDNLDVEATSAAVRAALEAADPSATFPDMGTWEQLHVPAPMIPSSAESALQPAIGIRTIGPASGVETETAAQEHKFRGEEDEDTIRHVHPTLLCFLKSKMFDAAKKHADMEFDSDEEYFWSPPPSTTSGDTDVEIDDIPYDEDTIDLEAGTPALDTSLTKANNVVLEMPDTFGNVDDEDPMLDIRANLDPLESVPFSLGSHIRSLDVDQFADVVPMHNDDFQHVVVTQLMGQGTAVQPFVALPEAAGADVSPFIEGVANPPNLLSIQEHPPQYMHSASKAHMGPVVSPWIRSQEQYIAPAPAANLMVNTFLADAVQNPPQQHQSMLLPNHSAPARSPTPSTTTFQPPILASIQTQHLTTPPFLNHSSLSPGIASLSFGASSSMPNLPASPSPLPYNTPSPLTPIARNPELSCNENSISSTAIPFATIPEPHSLPKDIEPAITTKQPHPLFDKLVSLGSPVPETTRGSTVIPVLLYFPQVLEDRSSGIDGMMITENTDALMLGYMHLDQDSVTATSSPGSRRTNEMMGSLAGANIALTSAIFLPAQIHSVLARRVKAGGYRVLERYVAHPSNLDSENTEATADRDMNGEDMQGLVSPIYANPHNRSTGTSAHAHAYAKLRAAMDAMRATSDREADVTKRWRVTPGPMTDTERGAVWEGWALGVERGLWMTCAERKGAEVGEEFLT